MMLAVGRQQQGEELLAQLRDRELLYLPSPTTATPPAVKVVESRRRRRGSKRGRDDGKTNNGQQDDDDQPGAARLHSCKTKRTKQQQKSSRRCLVTSVPDFDGYQWRKYGQKQIEGAMYARSYYRCTRSAEQGCPAKRTVQRNDDDAAAATYTVVYMGDHTCTANLEEAPPVILETAVIIPDNTSTTKLQRSSSSYDDDDTITTSAAASTTGSAATGTAESPAISSCWSSGSDDYSWVQEMEGPIRSPVHVPACWTIDHDHFLMMMQVVAANNERDCSYLASLPLYFSH